MVSDDPIVTQALAFIQDHCGEEIGVEAVLDHLGVSRRKLEARMKESIGQLPYTAITRARIERAKNLLAKSESGMVEVAKACGVAPKQFYVFFRRATGMTPGQYRRRLARHAAEKACEKPGCVTGGLSASA